MYAQIHRVPEPSADELKTLLNKAIVSEAAYRIISKDPDEEFSIKLTRAHISRIKVVGRNLVAFGEAVRALQRWHNPVHSLIFNVVWVFLCFNAHLFIPFILLALAALMLKRWFGVRESLRSLPVERQLPIILQELADEDSEDEDGGGDEDGAAADSDDDEEGDGGGGASSTKRRGPKNPLKQIQLKYRAVVNSKSGRVLRCSAPLENPRPLPLRELARVVHLLLLAPCVPSYL